MNQIFDECFWLWPKSECQPAIRSEQISDNGKSTSLHSLKEQRWPTRSNYSAVHLSQFQVWIDLGVYRDDFIFSGE
jgi:hypothetical protein